MNSKANAKDFLTNVQMAHKIFVFLISLLCDKMVDVLWKKDAQSMR